MAGVPLHYVDLRAFCYATEADDRVERALRTFLPEDHPVERDVSEGHHGDRIVVLSARVETADGMRHVLDAVGEAEDLNRIRSELDDRVDDNCSLFLQFDKQAAYNGTVRLGDDLTLRAKVEAYPAKKPQALENAREALPEA